MNKKWFPYTLWLLLFIPLFSLAQVPARPEPPRLVNDLAGILSQSEIAVLEDSLDQFAQKASTQIAVVTLSSLNGYDPGDMAFRIGESWGVGQKDKNNGIVILVKPKSGNEKGQVFISVGYGLEAVIPDAVAHGKIVDKEIIPRFKENDYFGGIMNGARIIMGLARGEFTADQYQKGSGKKGGGTGYIFFLLIFLVFILPIIRGGNRRSFNTGSRSLPFWMLMGGMLGSRGGGSWSDFSGGRGGFGGFGGGGGGGFGGFGGGSFGGGGAGGSW
jgi:uncharacterized protein